MTAATTTTTADPVLAALARIEARLDGLEARMQPALDLVEQGPAAVGTAIDIADDVARRLGDVEERLQAALALIEQVSAPQSLRQLQEGLTLLQQVPGLVATGLDIADAAFDKARAAGVDVGRLVPAIEAITFFWGRTLTSPATSSLVEAAGGREASALLEAAQKALQQTLHAPVSPVSMWGLVRALNDPAIQRALGLLLTFAHAFGEGLSSSSSRALPASSSSSSSSSSR